MSTPRIPDFTKLWNTSDDETATEWFRLVDSFNGGLFREPGTHDEDPAQVVVLLYVLAQTLREKANFLVFEPHKERLSELLERWSVPLGGSESPQYPFWRLQNHRFWRLMSWRECCETLDLPETTHAQYSADASVGILDERAWLAVMSDERLRQNLATYLTTYYWPGESVQVEEDIGLPAGRPAVRPSKASVSTSTGPRAKQPIPRFERNQAYATDALCRSMEIITSPKECPTKTIAPGSTALFISDSSWRIERASTNGSHEEVHWPFSNRHYDDWWVLAELSDADHVFVFTQEDRGQSYRYRGVYEPVSLEKRKWSFVRQIHDVVLRLVPGRGCYV
jgi:hypothetical protein